MVRSHPGRLAHIYSIVACDPLTGEMGVAVQSHWPSDGSAVTPGRREWGWPPSCLL
ncbi:MAG: DUF1028 domain-containing protein [Methanomassiliicoccus sp.]|nr:DUF1028 domain-containing protein [Methanomassiliicoccus sp.]